MRFRFIAYVDAVDPSLDGLELDFLRHELLVLSVVRLEDVEGEGVKESPTLELLLQCEALHQVES